MPKRVKTRETVKGENNSTGDILRNHRRKSDLTLDELGKYLGISSTAVQKYESNLVTPPPDKLIRLADLFDVSTDYLLGRTVKPQSEDIVARFRLEGAQEEVVAAFKLAYAACGDDTEKLADLTKQIKRLKP